MSKRSQSNEKAWNNFDRLLLEASKLNLSEELGLKNESQYVHYASYKKDLPEDCGSTVESSSVYSNSPPLSRNSTLSSIGTRNSLSSKFRSQESSNSNHTLRASDFHYPSNPTNDKLYSPLNSNLSHSHLSDSSSSYYPRKKSNHTTVEPNGCFVLCKNGCSTFQTTVQCHHHFIVPVFAIAGNQFANMLQLLFNYKEVDALTPKEDCEKTIAWQIDNNQSLVTISEFTYQDDHKDSSDLKQPLENLRQRLGITTILVTAPYGSISELYTLLDKLALSANEHKHSDLCSWWGRVVLVIDQQNLMNDGKVYDERKLFLMIEMPKIMSRYQLSEPLSILFVSTESFDEIKHTPYGGYYKLYSQRILWRMMEMHTLCKKWIYHDLGYTADDDLWDEDASSSCSDDMYMMATVIEYENGKRRRQKTNTQSIPNHEKLNCFPGDDGSSLPDIIPK
ncbi:hypothetical protein G6F46_003552 [Rhizopus delemar]|uniref:Uncharacterized protein n=2 Tax=Rhizopus TaxID=4842 RepID=A0A9P6Z6P5_9FUNG|nr:hypothetical protein G6F55_003675 [Rhizopus delemar]KAG1546006.1 hypothetical protein G6F51_005134 [Rhizopus arrhizus]KAG1499563.1 hypothetical protein G6F54_004325 [Rhizopus delemar]KAG1513269.1 hypothetical protein G6F53_004560 [Rhizopus delemar]KAG1527682.1 hypothetical protein G6F52_001321 [Rhizopus delemar]